MPVCGFICSLPFLRRLGLQPWLLPFTRIFFDSGYDAGAPAIGLMSFTMVLMGLTEYANKGFELEQNTRPVILNSAAATVIKVVSSVILIQKIGFLGGAVGSVIALGSYFLITAVRVRRYFMWQIAPCTFFSILLSSVLCGATAFGCTLLPVNDFWCVSALAIVLGGLTTLSYIIGSGEAREEAALIVKKLRRS